jgi:hypothetical protein
MIVVPANGTDGFYNELYRYAPGATVSFDALETEELGAANPDIVAQLHAKLLGAITT